MSSETYRTLFGQVSELVKLYLVSARLTLAEKIARLLTVLTLCAIIFVLSVVGLLFIALAIIHWISLGVGIEWAYMIMGCAFLILIAVLVVFKKQLICNPLARFISRLLFN